MSIGLDDPPSSSGDGRVDIQLLLQRCKDLARTIKSSQINPPIPFVELRNCVPPREFADQLVQNYFRTFESAFRVLHIPSFQNEYEQYWTNTDHASMSFVCQLFMVLAIGACFYQNETDDGLELRSQAVRWLFSVQSWLASPGEKRRLTITGLQIHCLVLLARQMLDVAGDLVWISTGTALRIAIQMGLHRDPRMFPKMSPLHSELRKRIWYTLLELDNQSLLDSGTPPTLSFDDFDTELPSNIDDSEISESTTSTPPPKPLTIFTQSTAQILLAKSLKVRFEIVRLMNHFRSTLSYDDVLRLTAEVKKSFSETAYLRQMHQNAQLGQTTEPKYFCYLVLEQLFHRVLLLLHRPFAIKAYSDPRYYFSRKIALESAFALVQPETDDDFTRMMDVGGGFLQAVLAHGAWTLCLDLIKTLEEDKANYSIEKNRAQRQPLLDAVRTAIDLSARQIKIHETNVKGHFFLSMTLGQIEAMAEGTSLEKSMFDAAERSAEYCYNLLRSRLRSKDPNVYNGLSDQMALDTVVSSTGAQQDFDLAFLQDPNIDFDVGQSWLFPGLFGNSWT
jgi:hypothetical protein